MGSEQPWNRLDGKIVLVMGASSGLGHEFCLDLAKAGCNVVAAACRNTLLESLCDQIAALRDRQRSEGRCGRAVAVQLDISAEEAAVEEAVRKAWRRIDVLVNNAGVRGTICSPLNLTETEWNQTINTNLRGTWLVSKCVSKLMVGAQQKGSIINIASVTGLNRGELPGALAYSVSKSGVNFVTKIMALELGKYNIRCNAINPGIFKSEITAGLMKKEWLDTVTSKTVPLRTLGTSDPALTTLVRYLAHDSSEYVNGNSFVADAGATLPGTICSPLGLTEKEWNQTINTNLRGTWLVSKCVSKLMVGAQQKGSIINIASVTGLNRGELPGALAYGVSKSGVNFVTKIMALELGKYNIRCNAINPGIFKSEIIAGLMKKEWLDTVTSKTVPLRTLGTSDPALTTLVRYLAHDSSEYVNGNSFVADAGATLPGIPIWSSL